MPKKTNTSSHLKFAVLSTDAVTFKIENKQLHVLLGKVQGNPFYPNDWAVIGGLIRPEETAEQAVERLLKDKAEITDIYKEQLYTFSEVDRDPRGRVVSVAYLALTKGDGEDVIKAHTETKWLPVGQLPKLAYDHNVMIGTAIERLQSRMGYTNIAQYFLPDEFTISDLQMVYETVLGREVDKRNFRKKIITSGILKDTKKNRKEGVMRPATLYRFISKEITFVNIL